MKHKAHLESSLSSAIFTTHQRCLAIGATKMVTENTLKHPPSLYCAFTTICSFNYHLHCTKIYIYRYKHYSNVRTISEENGTEKYTTISLKI